MHRVGFFYPNGPQMVLLPSCGSVEDYFWLVCFTLLENVCEKVLAIEICVHVIVVELPIVEVNAMPRKREISQRIFFR